MNETPSLQTVLTLTAGISPVPHSTFVWGTSSTPFSVGTHGDWAVNAPGVEPVHFFLRFDGKMIHLAGGPSGAPVQLSGAPVDQTWRPVPVFSEIVFGGARIRVTCEPAPARASEPPRTAEPPRPAEAATRAPQHPEFDATSPLGVRRVKTEPIVLPDRRPSTEPLAPPIVRDPAPEPPGQQPSPGATLLSPRGSQPPADALQPLPLGTVLLPRGSQPPAGASQPIPPGTVVLPRGSQPPAGALQPIPVAPVLAPRGSQPPAGARQPLPAGTMVSPGGSPVAAQPIPRGPSPEAMNEVPSVRQELPSDRELDSTLSDAGALKAHAKRVASEPKLANASADAYIDQVRRAAAQYGAAPPAHVVEALRQQAPSPFAQAPAVAAAPALVEGPAPLAGTMNESAADEGKAKKEKPKTSWVMRAVLVLILPAAYFAIFWQPPAAPPPPAEVTASAPTTSAPTTTGAAAPSGRAPAATSTSATTTLPTSAPSAIASSETTTTTPATSAPSVAPSSGAPSVSSVPGPNGSANVVVPITSNRPREALNAAFEGKYQEALAHYDALANGPGGEVYAVAARMLRERAFRKP